MLKNTHVLSIPGQVTAEVRSAWRTLETLYKTVPDIKDPQTGKIKSKKEIRAITHLHHAVDACTLGLIPLLIPAGNNGAIWKLLIERKLTTDEQRLVKNIAQPTVLALSQKEGKCSVSLKDIPKETKDSITEALETKRVVRHIPADMSGARLNEQSAGVVDYNPNGESATLRTRCDFYGIGLKKDGAIAIPRKEAPRFIIDNNLKQSAIAQYGQLIHISGLTGEERKKNGERQIIAIVKDEKKKQYTLRLSPAWNKGIPATELWELWKNGHIKLGKVLPVTECVKKSKLMGAYSPEMRKNKAVFKIVDNYGIVISPTIEIIRHASVYKTLKQLRTKHPKETFRILRNGMLISITSYKDETKNGKWRIMSIKENAQRGPVLDLQRMESAIQLTKDIQQRRWLEVRIDTILNSGLLIHEQSYIE